MTLFELGNESQHTPIELEDGYDGQPVLRLRPGATITAGLLRELNDLLGANPLTLVAAAKSPAAPLTFRSTEVASIPVPRGVVRIGRWPDQGPWIALTLVGLTDNTANLTHAGALALAETLQSAALALEA